MSKLAKALTAAAGNAGESLYVEDVFSTYLYEGNGTSQTITNGIDLDGEGGLLWMKSRSASYSHALFDTARSGTSILATDTSDAANPYGSISGITFNSNGFYLPDNNSYGWTNTNNVTYASWTFRKAKKFFDVQTWTGNGSTQNIAHNLGSVPAVIIVKSTTNNNSWCVYSSALGNTKTLFLDLTSGETTNASIWNSTTPTDSVFSVGNVNNVNESGQSFVAYLFASDAGGFGDDGSESIIKCGSFTNNSASVGVEVNCGFEPQWLLIKGASSGSGLGSWVLIDSMRGASVDSQQRLYPNASTAEGSSNWFKFTSQGFTPNTYFDGDLIYIAIRRPMKTPESGTEVFSPVTNTGTGSAANITTNFPVDLTIVRDRNNTDDDRNFVWDRLRGNSQRLTTQNTGAEQSASHVKFDYQDKIVTAGTSTWYNTANYIFWNFKRATGFFDVVAYTGDDVSTRTVAHNLGVTPEFIIVKRRDGTGNWVVYHEGTSANPEQNYLFLNATNQVQSSIAYWNYTAPTDTHFAVRSSNDVNGIIGGTYIAYLFATLDGVSKVGSYTGTGSNVDVDCGFSAGARFILIKRTESTGDWYVWDSERGIVAGNDPYLLLNSTAVEVTSTDYIDPLNSGFTVTSSAPAALNASGGNYIFLAIA